MTSVLAQKSGSHIESIAVPRPSVPFAWAGRAISIAVNRAVERATVAGAVRAQESGDGERLARYLARARSMHQRFDRPSSAQMNVAFLGAHITPSSHARSAWMQPEQIDERAVLVYVHGGSFIAERSPKLTALIARVAKAARLNTLMVDYRLAPEYPCPAAVEDVEAAVRDLIANGQAPDRIGIVAESAGASIALAATLRLRASGLRLGAVCLLSPWTDLALTGRSAAARSIAGDSPISMESMAICAHFYLQGRSPLDPIASPVYGNLDDLPPMLIHTSKTDSLHDDACLLADRAHEAGCAVTLRVWSRGSHVFEKLFDQQSERAIADVGMFFRERLGVARRARPS